jgi:hypothetical protein
MDARNEKQDTGADRVPFASDAGRGSTLCTRAENLHRAFQQVLKFAAFDPWASSSYAGALRDYNRIFFHCLKIATIYIHRYTLNEKIAQL